MDRSDKIDILVVDDESVGLNILSSMLSEQGYKVRPAINAQLALEAAREKTPDLILLDIRLPDMNGYELCRRLKADEKTAAVPVIFISAQAEIADKVKGFDVGAVDYVTKPLQVAEVLARVKTQLAMQALQLQLAENNQQLRREIEERKRAEAELKNAHGVLEIKVSERTIDLTVANRQLQQEVAERERIQEQLKNRNRELALLNRVIAASVTETETRAILQVACREMALAFNLPQATATLLNAEKTEATVAAEYLAEGLSTAVGSVISIEDNPACRYLLEHKRPFIAEDVQNDSELIAVYNILHCPPIASMLLVPLLIDDQVIGGLYLNTLEHRAFSGEEIGLACSVANQAAGVLARFRLDEQRRQLQIQYHQSQKMEAIGQLTGGVAHDFNNILTVILGNCSLIFTRLDPQHAAYAGVQQIEKAAEKAASLTRQLLAFSRQQVLQPKLLDLNQIVASIEKLLRHLIGENTTLEMRLDPKLDSVEADSSQLEQVLMNLVVNARDAMPSGGQISIETRNANLGKHDIEAGLELAAGHYVTLTVIDNGHGMDESVRARIFEPFFTTKDLGKGTGLGLATVYGIVKQSGGQIRVDSAPGQGARFVIYLPAIRAKAGVEPPSQRSTLHGRGRASILLVEDDQAVRKLLTMMLQDEGYTVLVASNGVEALSVAERHADNIDLLLTDVAMPEMDGWQLSERLKQVFPQLKVLLISGYTNHAAIRDGLVPQQIEFLAKPFSPEVVQARVREMLNG